MALRWEQTPGSQRVLNSSLNSSPGCPAAVKTAVPGQVPGLRNPTTILTAYLRLSQRAQMSDSQIWHAIWSDALGAMELQQHAMSIIIWASEPVLNIVTASAPMAKGEHANHAKR